MKKLIQNKIDYMVQISLAVLVATLFFVVNIVVWGPTIQGDEGGYLSYAAAIAGYRVDNATSYYSGYSLLIAPAFYWQNQRVKIKGAASLVYLAAFEKLWADGVDVSLVKEIDSNV